jgi:hypothetical protein
MAKIEYRFNPFELVGVDPEEVSSRKKKEILSEVADFVLESILSDCDDLRSPVTGGKFKKLSSDYSVAKKKQGGSPVPNLVLDGDMLSSIRTKRQSDEISIYIPSGLQAKKADNHCKFSPESESTPVPARKFIPNSDKDETFRPAIRKGIREIIQNALDEGDE